MKKFLLAATAAMGLAMGAAAPANATGFNPCAGFTNTPSLNAANGHYYMLVCDYTTWSDALTTAATYTHLGMTGYLATVTSAQEESFIANLVRTDNNYHYSIWLAGSDQDQEGTWKWMAGPETGQLLTYTNWAGGEPNNLWNEDYLEGLWNVWNWNGTQWNDTRSDRFNNNKYVVEFNPAPGIPEPESWAMLIAGFGFVGAAMRRRQVKAVVA